MRLVPAILCSMLLMGTSFLSAQVPVACPAPNARACCQDGAKMSCCQTRPDSKPDSQPSPAVPIHNNPQSAPILALVPALVFAAPAAGASRPDSAFSPLSLTASPGLYARNCALLL